VKREVGRKEKGRHIGGPPGTDEKQQKNGRRPEDTELGGKQPTSKFGSLHRAEAMKTGRRARKKNDVGKKTPLQKKTNGRKVKGKVERKTKRTEEETNSGQTREERRGDETQNKAEQKNGKKVSSRTKVGVYLKEGGGKKRN